MPNRLSAKKTSTPPMTRLNQALLARAITTLPSDSITAVNKTMIVPEYTQAINRAL